MPQIILEDWNLQAAERRLCVAALELAGNLVGAARILGITRHAPGGSSDRFVNTHHKPRTADPRATGRAYSLRRRILVRPSRTSRPDQLAPPSLRHPQPSPFSPR